MAIRVGDSVEICCNEDGFLGSYYEAKIIAKRGKNKFLVEYKTLLKEDNEKELLKEVVEASTVRPLPPQINVSEFHVLEKVDAFDNDGWWVGRISGRAGYKYYVYFESSGDEFLYPFGSLRIHQEYENGQWIPANKRADT
ncbi:DUF724 domain-containing protein 7-like [Coffea eugenioides]|uniref:DUF724 domain-containing protein 7-like n=1 Tax=Coffea arabica TaxID=13443 RepID=A0A6P6SAC3_COFAR|nr:DUF724 domain-containing protein 7-like [Coffea arabica]XP_027063143.1 DUF724 domain-containing protein 7-like [Coffea arabica]XP_027172249.1 DUF724 domain-containing protein 7-like [Coffea eugenioides]